MGQVAMATNHGGRPTVLIGGMWYQIDEQTLGLLGEGLKGARASYPLPKMPQMVGEAKEGRVNNAELHCKTTTQSNE